MTPPVAHGALLSADDAEQQFYEALQRADLERLMQLWSDDDEVCCVHPGGERLVGAAAIRASFEAMFANGPVALHPDGVRRLQLRGLAVHSVLERLHLSAPGPAGGISVMRSVWIVATNVYVETPLGWRLVAHHASPGTSAEPAALAEGPAVLH